MDTRSNAIGADAGHGISFNEAFRVWVEVAVLSFGRPGRADRGTIHPT